jgi:hypothetical protein
VARCSTAINGFGLSPTLRHSLTEVVPFQDLKSAPQLIAGDPLPVGYQPQALANASLNLIAVYLPIGGSVSLRLPAGSHYQAGWFDPRTGEMNPVSVVNPGHATFTAPSDVDSHPSPHGRLWDWVLVLKS